jgi:3-hydroxyisobutyrate dehydrogenase-like beta-hydroxyacid dehydrogenase
MRVGFVGLGNIGRPMALRLARAEGLDLQVYDVAPGPVADLVAAGATAATSVRDMDVDVLCVMVRDDDQVRSVAAGSRQARPPGARPRGARPRGGRTGCSCTAATT